MTAVTVSGGAAPKISADERRYALDRLSDGVALEAAGKRAEAIAAYGDSIAHAPSPAAYFRLGQALEASGKKDDARTAYQQALVQSPAYESARLALKRLGGKPARTPTTAGQATPAAGLDYVALQRESETVSTLAPPDGALRVVTTPAPGATSLPERSVRPAARKPLAPATVATETPRPTPAPAAAKRLIREGIWPFRRTVAAIPADDGTTPALSAARNGIGEKKFTASDINAVAFGPEAAKQKPSVGYGSTTGVSLGTFAFHRDRGDQYRSVERWRDALTEYELALRQAPGDAETRALLGEMQARAGMGAEALRNLEQARADAPNLAAVPYRLGNAQRALRRTDSAIASYNDALRLDPKFKEALNNLGVTLMEAEKYDRAADAFERLLKLDPANANALLNLGILHDDYLNETPRAVEFYKQYLAIKDVPRQTEVRRWLQLAEKRLKKGA